MRVVLGLSLLLATAGLAQAADTQPVGFRIGARIPSGTPWVRLQATDAPFGCKDLEVVAWQEKDNQRLQDSGFEGVFREGLSKAGFKVAGDPSNLFEEDTKSTDIQVGALVTALDAKFCQTQTFKDSLVNSDHYVIMGSATMKVEWQIYSTSQAKIVARIPTTATFELKKPVDAGNHLILNQVFAANVAQLTGSDAFRTALNAPAAPVAAATLGPLNVAYRSASAAMPLKDAAKGVVSIFAGDGMGSGVLISPDGYILTNHHVAGDSGKVRIRWPDGKDTVGEVVRSNRRRDVALIKTEARAQPLAIRQAAANLGETVFAIGTPLDRQLSGTLTRGVVSTASRTYEGQPFIQSDVGVTHGNSGGPLLDEKGAILGLTVIGLYPDESKSLNLFIPINDALKVLAVQPAS